MIAENTFLKKRDAYKCTWMSERKNNEWMKEVEREPKPQVVKHGSQKGSNKCRIPKEEEKKADNKMKGGKATALDGTTVELMNFVTRKHDQMYDESFQEVYGWGKSH